MGCCKSVCGYSNGGCGGSCERSGCAVTEAGINVIVELEIHYTVSIDQEKETYIFENLSYLTNIQALKTEVTGLEGKRFDTLKKMQEQIMEYMKKTHRLDDERANNVTVFYIETSV